MSCGGSGLVVTPTAIRGRALALLQESLRRCGENERVDLGAVAMSVRTDRSNGRRAQPAERLPHHVARIRAGADDAVDQLERLLVRVDDLGVAASLKRSLPRTAGSLQTLVTPEVAWNFARRGLPLVRRELRLGRRSRSRAWPVGAPRRSGVAASCSNASGGGKYQRWHWVKYLRVAAFFTPQASLASESGEAGALPLAGAARPSSAAARRRQSKRDVAHVLDADLGDDRKLRAGSCWC